MSKRKQQSNLHSYFTKAKQQRDGSTTSPFSQEGFSNSSQQGPATPRDVNVPAIGGDVNVPAIGGDVNVPAIGGDVNVPATGGDVNVPSTSARKGDIPSASSVNVKEKSMPMLLDDSGKSAEQQATECKRKKLYTDKFSDKWLQLEDFSSWLKKSEAKRADGGEYALCKICKVNIKAHKKSLFDHSKSQKHTQTVERSKQVSIPQMCSRQISIDDKVKRAEIKLVSVFAEGNVPIAFMDLLTPVIADVFSDPEVAGKLQLKRTKAHAVLGKVGDHFSAEQDEVLKKPGCFFSAIMDETTDRSTKKQCAFVVIYFDAVQNSTKTRFFDMVEPESGTAQGLYQTLRKSLEKKNIPFSNLVGFSSDTTNVMFGDFQSVVALLKADNPNIVAVRCSCHLIHLAASAACLKLPKSVEDVLRELPSHFNRSSVRKGKFEEYQKFCGTELHNLLSKSNTRWLSVKQCVDRVLEQYEPLQKYLEDEVLPEDPTKTMQGVCEAMRNSFTMVYLEFMSYVLGLLNDFNILFQSERPLLYRVKPEIEKLFKTICLNFLKTPYVRENSMRTMFVKVPANHRKIEELYIGMPAYESLSNLIADPNCKRDIINKFRLNCLEFYIELAQQIKKRFSYVYTEPIFQLINILEPSCARSGEIPSLMPVFNAFPILRSTINICEAEKEWREHSLLNYIELGLTDIEDAEEYWMTLFSKNNGLSEPMFRNLKSVIGLLMTLPFSNASVERVFSSLNSIKTQHRTAMGNDTLLNIMHTKHGLKEGGTLKFEPPLSLIRKQNAYN